MLLPPRKAWCSVFFIRLCVSSSLQTLTCLSSVCKANLDLSVKIMLLQSANWHIANTTLIMLLWIRRIEEHKLRVHGQSVHFMCSLRLTVVPDIVLPMEDTTIDVTNVQVALRFRLYTQSIYLSTAWNCAIMNAERNSNI